MLNEETLLKTRRFLPLFVTQFLGALNDNVFKNALAILITYRIAATAGLNSQLMVILAAGLFILPFFLFSATAGQLADKFEKSRLILIIKSIEIILMGIATYGFCTSNLYAMFFTLFALGTHSTFFGPMKYSLLPELLQEDELIAGNGLIEAGTFIAILLGTMIGGMFILKSHGDVVVSTLMLIIALGGWLASWFIPKTNNINANVSMSWNIIKDTSELIQYSRKQSDIFLSILGISWFWLFGSIFLLEFPVLAKDVFHATESIETLFLTIFSIGLAIGSVLCNRLLKGKVHANFVPLGVLGMTLFTINLYFTAKHPISSEPLIGILPFLTSATGWNVCFDLLCIAICGGIYTVPLYAILQSRSDKEHRARVIASNNIINALFMVLASVGAMILVKIGFSAIQLLLAIGILNGLVAIYICQLLPDPLIRSFFHCVLKFLYRVEVKGLENYTAAGERVIIIANHTSFIDAILLATFLPDKLTFAINTFMAEKWWIKLFSRLVDSYPIDPTNPMALKSLIQLAQTNTKCVIFPEGRLTVTGALMKIYEGPGLMADKSGAKLLPIQINGTQYTPFSRMQGKFRMRLMPKVTVTIFPAETINISHDVKGKERRQQINNFMYDVMTHTAFESNDYRKTLFSSLIEARHTHGSRHPILEDINRTVTNYQQFITRSFILGHQIAKQTEPGECVGVLLPNMVSNVITFFAMQAYCRIPGMLNYSTGIKNVVIACQTAKIQTIYSSRQFVELGKLEDLIAALKNAGMKIIYLEDIRSQVSFLDKIKGMICGKFPRYTYERINQSHLHLFDANETAVILFTSGSEGTPKGVVLSHKNIQANRYQLTTNVDFTTKDLAFNALPIFHSFGLTAGTLLPVLSGVRTFLYPSPLHFRQIPELVYDTSATILFGTDTFLTGYAKYAHQYDFYSVRYIFAGAEKLRDETRMTWSEKFGLRILEGYGATETSPVIAINTPLQHQAGTVGRLLPGIRYQINPVPGISDGGVLCVAGPNIMKGYLLADQPGVLVSYDQKWYETGDVVSIDSLGFVSIKGRIKRFAKIAGEMVSLTMVEQQINQLWPEHQHAVINIPHEKKGEELLLATTYPAATRENIVAFAKETAMGEIAIPKKIVVLPNMPLLGTGKIDYVALKQLILQEAS